MTTALDCSKGYRVAGAGSPRVCTQPQGPEGRREGASYTEVYLCFVCKGAAKRSRLLNRGGPDRASSLQTLVATLRHPTRSQTRPDSERGRNLGVKGVSCLSKSQGREQEPCPHVLSCSAERHGPSNACGPAECGLSAPTAPVCHQGPHGPPHAPGHCPASSAFGNGRGSALSALPSVTATGHVWSLSARNVAPATRCRCFILLN